MDGGDEAIAQLLEQDRRHDRVLAVLMQEPPQVLRALQPWDVAVQIQPVDAVDVERDVIAQ